MKNLSIAFVVILGFLVSPSVSRAQIMCTMQYQPVCAAQQVQCIQAPCYPQYHTYGNACVANADGATFIHEGECTAVETGPVAPRETYTPPLSCTSWYDGCNSCARASDGGSVCTKKYCENPEKGYCTAYATSTKPGIEDIATSGATTIEDLTPWKDSLWQSIFEGCKRFFSVFSFLKLY